MSLMEIESIVKSCVLSKKGDMTLTALREEYQELVGENIPFKRLGYEYLEDLLRKLPGVHLSRNIEGNITVSVKSQKAAHIAGLVDRQRGASSKSSKKVKKKVTHLVKRNVPVPKGIPLKYKSSASPDGKKYMSSWKKLSKVNGVSDSFHHSKIECASGTKQAGHYRSVCVTEQSLHCTISAEPPLAGTRSRTRSIDDYSLWDGGPSMLSFHFVGDDFLVHFAYQSLNVDCDWDGQGLSCGMCISGQTILDFHTHFLHEAVNPPKIVIMLGTVDILQGIPFPRIVDDMTELLQDIIPSMQCVVILTLPFLLNGGSANRNILLFNDFLKSLGDGNRVHVIDVHPLFSTRKGRLRESYNGFENCINSKCYQRSSSRIFCTPEEVFLWSHIGRSNLYNCLVQKLAGLLNRFSL